MPAPRPGTCHILGTVAGLAHPSRPAHPSRDAWQALPTRPGIPIAGLAHTSSPARPSRDACGPRPPTRQGLPTHPGPRAGPPAHAVAGLAHPSRTPVAGHAHTSSPAHPSQDAWRASARPVPGCLAGLARPGPRPPTLKATHPSRDAWAGLARPSRDTWVGLPRPSRDALAGPRPPSRPKPGGPPAARPGKPGGPRPPVPGCLVSRACPSGNAWRASPARPGTPGGPRPRTSRKPDVTLPPVRRLVSRACSSRVGPGALYQPVRDAWRASPARPWTRPLAGPLPARPGTCHFLGPVAGLAHPSRPAHPSRDAWLGLAHPPPGTPVAGPRPHVKPRPSLEAWRASARTVLGRLAGLTRPFVGTSGTPGRPHPPVPRNLVGPADQSKTPVGPHLPLPEPRKRASRPTRQGPPPTRPGMPWRAAGEAPPWRPGMPGGPASGAAHRGRPVWAYCPPAGRLAGLCPAPSRDAWRASAPPVPRCLAGLRPPARLVGEARPGHLAALAKPSPEKARMGPGLGRLAGLATPVPGRLAAPPRAPARPGTLVGLPRPFGTPGGPRPPVHPGSLAGLRARPGKPGGATPTRRGKPGELRCPSRDAWRAAPAHPGTPGGPLPARPRTPGGPLPARPWTPGGPLPARPGTCHFLGPVAGLAHPSRPVHPSRDAWRALPTRPGTPGGPHMPLPETRSGPRLPARPGTPGGPRPPVKACSTAIPGRLAGLADPPVPGHLAGLTCPFPKSVAGLACPPVPGQPGGPRPAVSRNRRARPARCPGTPGRPRPPIPRNLAGPWERAGHLAGLTHPSRKKPGGPGLTPSSQDTLVGPHLLAPSPEQPVEGLAHPVKAQPTQSPGIAWQSAGRGNARRSRDAWRAATRSSRDAWRASWPRPSRDAWRASLPALSLDAWRAHRPPVGGRGPPGTPGSPRLNLSRETWRARLTSPKTPGGPQPAPSRKPVSGPRPSVKARPPVQGRLVAASPVRPGTPGGPPNPARSGRLAGLARPSREAWRASPARPGKPGGPRPPVAGSLPVPGRLGGTSARPSLDAWRASARPVRGPCHFLGPGSGPRPPVKACHPSRDAWRALPTRPGTPGGPHMPLPENP
ncbi:basic proline-rich protein-like [Macrobrachium nipponense]|uniref:basic proline-rich protein-like n=1 Tax=Macrobrachium nipponense TaxID=159736 RepID=UPI0030C8A21C